MSNRIELLVFLFSIIFIPVTAQAFDLKSLQNELGGALKELEKNLDQELSNQNQQKNSTLEPVEQTTTKQQAERPNQKYLSGRILDLGNGRISARCRYENDGFLQYEQIKGTPINL